FSWSNGANSPNLSGLASGSYLLTVTDQSGCFTQQAVFVSQPDEIAIDFTISPVPCNQKFGSANADVSGGTAPYQYVWSNGSNSAFNNLLEEGTYIVTVSDNNTCSNTASVTITKTDTILIQTFSTPDDGSGNGTASVQIVSGTPPFNISWSNG